MQAKADKGSFLFDPEHAALDLRTTDPEEYRLETGELESILVYVQTVKSKFEADIKRMQENESIVDDMMEEGHEEATNWTELFKYSERERVY